MTETTVRRSLKDLAQKVADRQPAAQESAALREALGGLQSYREGLVRGRLRVCGNCAHFTAGETPIGLGNCRLDGDYVFPLVQFFCPTFAVGSRPLAPGYLPVIE